MEMKSRMRATAPLRTGASNSRSEHHVRIQHGINVGYVIHPLTGLINGRRTAKKKLRKLYDLSNPVDY